MVPRTFKEVIAGNFPTGAYISQATQPLIKTLRTSDPLVEDAAETVDPKKVLGLFAPGLSPMETMLPQFFTVADYPHYRIHDTAVKPYVKELRVMFLIKSNIDGFSPTLDNFDGLTPIHLLPLLEKLPKPLTQPENRKRYAFETCPTSSGTTPRTVTKHE